MMKDKQFRTLSQKVDTLIKLTAINAVKGKNLTRQVEILSEIGLQPKEIAAITGADPNTVSVLKSRLKSRKSMTGENKTPQEGGEI